MSRSLNHHLFLMRGINTLVSLIKLGAKRRIQDFYLNIILNYYLFKIFKLLKINKFNYLINILTLIKLKHMFYKV
jgi:hypothetical protein